MDEEWEELIYELMEAYPIVLYKDNDGSCTVALNVNVSPLDTHQMFPVIARGECLEQAYLCLLCVMEGLEED